MKSIILLTSLFFGFTALAASKVHTSISGIEYIQDESIPLFGEAYRSPEGVIWGSPRQRNGVLVWQEYGEALNYCKQIGGRLPHKFEILNLVKDLSKPPYGYNPSTLDGSELMLPYLDSIYWVQDDGAFYYLFSRGTISGSNINPGNGRVRCVAGKIWDGQKNSGPLMISTETVVEGGWPGEYCQNLATKCDRLETKSDCTDSLTYDDWRLPTPKELQKFVGMKDATDSMLPTHSYDDTDYVDALRLTDGKATRLRWRTSILYPKIDPMSVRCVR